MSVISVVTVTFQRHELLARKAESLRAQSLAPGLFEWCVASNGDPQASTFLQALQAPFAVNAVALEDNLPIGTARNAAAARATGEVLLMSDDDVLLPAECLAAHLTAHGYDPSTGAKVVDQGRPRVVIGPLRLPAELRADREGEELAGAAERPLRPESAKRRVRVEREPFERAFAVAGRAMWINATGANTSLPRTAFTAVGGYDPAFAAYGGEDSDLALRLREFGATFVRSDAAWAEHVGLVSGDVIKAAAAGRAGVRVWRKHARPSVGLMLGVHPLSLAVKRALLGTPLRALFGARTAAYEEAFLRGAAEELKATKLVGVTGNETGSDEHGEKERG